MFPVEPISAKMLDYYVGRRDAFLIDLRSREEYRTGHMKGAVNLPYEEFEEMSEYDFPRGKDPGAVLRPGRGKPSGGKSAGKKWI